ncbi:MAG: adenylyl-sulfate kinase [Actinomycetes bacterium]
MTDGPTGAAEAAALRKVAATWPEHLLTPAQYAEVELLLNGALAPRTGFTRDEPLAVRIDVVAGNPIALRDDEGAAIAAMDVEDVWTGDDGHRLAAGPLRAIEGVVHHDFRDYRQTPDDVRKLAAEHGWTRLLAYQPRQAVTQEQVDVLLSAAQRTQSAVMLQPLHRPHDVGDLEWYARARSAVLVGEVIAEELGADQFALALTPDPGEALGARVARNYGATHLAIDAGARVERDEVGSALELVRLAETRTATLLPAVAAEVAGLHPPADRSGFTVFFTGLSGSGKSTVAKAVAARLLEIGPRRVTLLDGDVVRRHLSSELTFSAEHRDLNIRRIGFVAGEVTRHGGVAVCAPIAPYDATRKDVRAMVEKTGGFVLVHVATPVEVCEDRDRKGLYARARAGDLPGFTGVSDPYEMPTDAEVSIDTTTGTVDDAADIVLSYLRTAGWLGAD